MAELEEQVVKMIIVVALDVVGNVVVGNVVVGLFVVVGLVDVLRARWPNWRSRQVVRKMIILSKSYENVKGQLKTMLQVRQEQSKEVVKEDYCINGCPLDVAEEMEVYPAILDIIIITAIITVIIITVMIITVIIITDIITVIITVMIITIRFIAPSSTWWRLSGGPVGWMRFLKVEIVRSHRALIIIIMMQIMVMIMIMIMIIVISI